MTLYYRKPTNGPARASFIVSLSSLLPVIVFAVIALLITNDISADLRENPERMSMISGDFIAWIPIVMVGFTVAAPAAAAALAFGIWSLQRPGLPRRLGIAGIVISSVVLLLGVVALIGAYFW